MNKRKVDELIPKAVQVLSDVGIAKDNEMEKAYRGQISSFGASISTGSLLAAISYFSKQQGNDRGDKEKVDRTLLIRALEKLLDVDADTGLFKYVTMKKGVSEKRKVKEDIKNASIALKLAMNLYSLSEGEKSEGKKDEQ